MRFPRRFEATISRADFVRLLPLATGEPDVVETADGYAGRGWSLRLTPMAPLEIGSVTLERHGVELDLDGMDAVQADAFLRRMARYYQRGGG